MTTPSQAGTTPRSTIVILLDIPNRHMLGAYSETEFAIPNLDRFAQRALRFERHYAGSLPRVAARSCLFPHGPLNPRGLPS